MRVARGMEHRVKQGASGTGKSVATGASMRAVCGGLLAGLLLAWNAAVVLAAEDAATPRGNMLIAQAGDAQRFSIPGQSLASALKRFSEETGISFAYKTEDVANRM